jgi:hypothetical protein
LRFNTAKYVCPSMKKPRLYSYVASAFMIISADLCFVFLHASIESIFRHARPFHSANGGNFALNLPLFVSLNEVFCNTLALSSEPLTVLLSCRDSFGLSIAYLLRHVRKQKAELILALESKQNFDQQLHAFKKEVGRFITLDFDEQVMKQVLQRLIHKIEVFEGERIKIHYNLSNPYAIN